MDEFNIKKEESRKLLSRIVLSLVAIFGIIFIIIGALSIYKQNELKTKYLKVVGKVVSNKTDPDGRFIPTYLYEVEGKTYNVESDYSYLVMPNVGTEHNIYYLPEKVGYGIPEYFDTNQLLLVIGAMMLTLPLVIYLLDKDSQKYDRLAKFKSAVIVILGFVYLLGSGMLLNTTNIGTIFMYSNILVIMPILYIGVGIYAFIVSNYEEEKKITKFLNIFKKKKA